MKFKVHLPHPPRKFINELGEAIVADTGLSANRLPGMKLAIGRLLSRKTQTYNRACRLIDENPAEAINEVGCFDLSPGALAIWYAAGFRPSDAMDRSYVDPSKLLPPYSLAASIVKTNALLVCCNMLRPEEQHDPAFVERAKYVADIISSANPLLLQSGEEVTDKASETYKIVGRLLGFNEEHVCMPRMIEQIALRVTHGANIWAGQKALSL